MANNPSRFPFKARPAEGREWWRGAVIYQVYPRSFQDSNGDGIGDLAGITSRLDYLARLGVDAVWISPFFKSPMIDFGYDVADYCDVDPIFGTIEDFDALIARAHELRLRIMIDLVFAHTSDQHPWFQSSRTGADAAHSDWYVWRDANPDGTPPNNWQSVFGGAAWTWDARRRQYYMHQFLKEQPQLDVHKPAVQAALLAAMRFWLDRGVDGFRMDALNHAMFDPRFRDNPPAPDNGRPRNRSYDFQEPRYSMSHPDVVGFVERIRGLCDGYGAIFTLAEVGGSRAEHEMKAYTAGDARLNSAYGFNFLYSPGLDAATVTSALGSWQGGADADGRRQGWPSWAFENHDASRASRRWFDRAADTAELDAFVRVKTALLIALRGNAILFEGEELGLLQDDIPFELLKDPEAIANWPHTLSRDGVRTPMPWDAALPHGGFTSGEPWLPLFPGNLNRAVAAQEADPASLLHHTRLLLALRKGSAALRQGGLRILREDGPVLLFERFLAGETLQCAFNFGDRNVGVTLADGNVLGQAGGATARNLPKLSYIFVRRD